MSTASDPAREELADSLHSAAIHLLRKLRRADVRSRLNAPRLSALSVIVFGGPLTLGQLAAAEQVRPPTMTRIVHALEARGLVKKNANAQDRRTLHLSATTKGRRVMHEARARRIHSLATQIEKLSRREQERLRDGLEIIGSLIREL
ncbi:MAG TPA: MarR family transcriptional regulator [Bryobacteraceae bacterium]|nr:MarR family transcriptional regulator [Bryobacteraceae bacterium]